MQDEATPVAASSVTDPESLRDRGDVEFVDETEDLDREAYETVRERTETTDGVAIVGVTDDEGKVLLSNTCTGWAAPGGDVAAGEDWSAVARREVESWTGIGVEIDGIARVQRIDHRLDGGESTSEPILPFHVVYFRATPTASETDLDESDPVDADDADVGWFDEIPTGVDEDWGDELRVFFD